MKRATFDDEDTVIVKLESRILELEDDFALAKDQNEEFSSRNEELLEEFERQENEISELLRALIDIHKITDVLIEKLNPTFSSEWKDLFVWNESTDVLEMVGKRSYGW